MNETISTDSLLRFVRATPEQRAAIDRFLLGAAGELGGSSQARQGDQSGGSDGLGEALGRIERKLDAVQAATAGKAGPEVRVGELEAQRVFLLLKSLEGGPKERKAPLATVFRLLVLGGLSQRAAAARCGCVESLMSARVAAIEGAFGMAIERLRSFASELLSLEAAAKGERRRKKQLGRPDDLEHPEGAAEDGEEERFGDQEEDRSARF
jgi:hypothetical protein